MEGKSGVTRSIIDELLSSEIQRDQMDGESGVTRSIIDELLYLDIQGDQIEGQRSVNRSINDEFHSSDMTKWKVKVVLLEESLMKFILERSKEIKWKV